jgi:hypothetical protein
MAAMAKPPSRNCESEKEYERRLLSEGWYDRRPEEQRLRATLIANAGTYRVRWAVVSHSNGYRFSREKMCIAERRYSFLGLFGFWLPFEGAEWRFDERRAEQDIERDRYLREPLPDDQLIA